MSVLYERFPELASDSQPEPSPTPNCRLSAFRILVTGLMQRGSGVIASGGRGRAQQSSRRRPQRLAERTAGASEGSGAHSWP